MRLLEISEKIQRRFENLVPLLNTRAFFGATVMDITRNFHVIP